MNGPWSLIGTRRRELGLTQAELCRRAGVSLATCQNIEAGRANPSYTTLCRVLDALGLDLACTGKPADWDGLAAMGLPLTGSAPAGARGDADLLAYGIRRAALDVSESSVQEGAARKREALQALLLAISSHFPEFFQKRLAGSSAIERAMPRELTGRLIRLSRASRSTLAEYL